MYSIFRKDTQENTNDGSIHEHALLLCVCIPFKKDKCSFWILWTVDVLSSKKTINQLFNVIKVKW